jgi:hypothetical protein
MLESAASIGALLRRIFRSRAVARECAALRAGYKEKAAAAGSVPSAVSLMVGPFVATWEPFTRRRVGHLKQGLFEGIIYATESASTEFSSSRAVTPSLAKAA